MKRACKPRFKTVLGEAAQHLAGELGMRAARDSSARLAELKDRPLKEVVRGDWELDEDDVSLLLEAVVTGQAARR